jgi:hypothetical protein
VLGNVALVMHYASVWLVQLNIHITWRRIVGALFFRAMYEAADQTKSRYILFVVTQVAYRCGKAFLKDDDRELYDIVDVPCRLVEKPITTFLYRR